MQPFLFHLKPLVQNGHFPSHKARILIVINKTARQLIAAWRSENTFVTDKNIYPIPDFSFGFYSGFNLNILKLFDNYVLDFLGLYSLLAIDHRHI